MIEVIPQDKKLLSGQLGWRSMKIVRQHCKLSNLPNELNLIPNRFLLNFISYKSSQITSNRMLMFYILFPPNLKELKGI